MRFVLQRAALVVAAFLVAGCDSNDPTEQSSNTIGDPVRGRLAFVADCASCHASGDGIDLAAFHFTDTTIIRRAVKHVDTTTARNIVAHIRSLHATELDEQTRLFQPGGSSAPGDVDLAIELFGTDAFPADMTTARMLAIAPRQVRVAVKMPVWSDEQANVDWMPDVPLPDAILDDQGGLARGAIAGYRAAPTRENLARAVAALRTADRRMANMNAPCLLEDTLRVDFAQCFQVRRWTSSLVAQHLIRYGITDQIDLALHDVWWDVGNAARKSIRNGTSVIENARQNWAAWMYLSWSFAPGQHASVYTGGGLNNIGLPRHATFVALRSEVARPRGTVTPYEDARSATNFAPAGWAYNVASFAFMHLNERLDAGEKPAADALQTARDAITTAVLNAQRKVPIAQRATIAQWGDALKARLQ
jgi:hypothetical protein